MTANLFFTSDTHYGHRNIIKYEKRGPMGKQRLFDSVEEHDEYLIERWNETVQPEDTVWHLGDVGFRKEKALAEILNRLNGRKHLILGNHDGFKLEFYSLFFESVGYYKELKGYGPPGTHLVLMHYPLEIWNKRHYGSFHLHGHCHGNLIQRPNEPRYDVGVDTNLYAPVALETILTHFKNVKAEPNVKDHHGRDG